MSHSDVTPAELRAQHPPPPDVMAAFVSPLDAVTAALEIVAAFPEESADTRIRLRVSLHTGPCIAVRIHQGIDYFGGTVNLSAKLQALADGGCVVVSRRTYDAPGVAERLREHGGALEEAEYRSAALDQPLAAMRLRSAPCAPVAAS